MKHPAQINVKFKDTIFRLLFQNKEPLLELYNAVSGKKYQNPDQLEIVTLENAIYMKIKNDLAFLIDFHLYLYEHQSTVNPNMPLRFLQYVVDESNRLIDTGKIYGRRLLKIPTPHFVVFYNGTEPYPEHQRLKLSDAFEIPESNPELELHVLVLNINDGFNEKLKEQCQTLREYMQYVNQIRKYAATMPVSEAVTLAVDDCIRNNILKEFLSANKAEVMNMSIYEFDEEAYYKDLYEQGLEDGIAREQENTVRERLRADQLEQELIQLRKRLDMVCHSSLDTSG